TVGSLFGQKPPRRAPVQLPQVHHDAVALVLLIQIRDGDEFAVTTETDLGRPAPALQAMNLHVIGDAPYAARALPVATGADDVAAVEIPVVNVGRASDPRTGQVQVGHCEGDDRGVALFVDLRGGQTQRARQLRGATQSLSALEALPLAAARADR